MAAILGSEGDREGSSAAIEVPGEAVVLALSGEPIYNNCHVQR
jgi:hypothetical protein